MSEKDNCGMFQKTFLYFLVLSALAATAAPQNFILDVGSSTAIPTGSIQSPASVSAGSDAQGNFYVLVNGLVYVDGGPGFDFVPVSQLVKLNSAGAILYQTVLPSAASAMGADQAGNLYLVTGGNTVEKLASDGKTVVYQTTIGGPNVGAWAVAVDSAGRAYVTGADYASDLYVTSGAFQSTASSSTYPNGFVVRLTPSGTIDYATYLGAAVDNPYGIAVDSAGSAFVIWTTLSSVFPVTPGAFQTSGLSMLARLKPDGSGLIYSTFTGGPVDTATYVAVNSSDEAVVASTSGDDWGIPVTGFNPQGGAVFSTRLAGQGIGGLSIDMAGNSYLFDKVLPSAANYPTKNNLSTCSSAANGLTVFQPDGAILQSTFLPATELIYGIITLPDMTANIFTGSYTASSGQLSMTHLFQNPEARTFQLACIGNGASFDSSSVSPGEIVSLFGSGLGPAAGAETQLDASGRFPTELADVQVMFGSSPGRLLYVQGGQINSIVPWSYQGGAVCITYNGTTTNCLEPPVTQAHPGIFTVAPYEAAAINEDGSINSASNPAQPGSVVSILATGLGPTNPPESDGAITSYPLPVNVLPVAMYSGSANGNALIQDTITYVGPAPFEVAGLSQINFIVAPNQPGGPYDGQIAVGPPDNQIVSNFFYVYVAQ